MVECAFEIRFCRAGRTFTRALGALDSLLFYLLDFFFLALPLEWSLAALRLLSLFLMHPLAAVPDSVPGLPCDTNTNHVSKMHHCQVQ